VPPLPLPPLRLLLIPSLWCGGRAALTHAAPTYFKEAEKRSDDAAHTACFLFCLFLVFSVRHRKPWPYRLHTHKHTRRRSEGRHRAPAMDGADAPILSYPEWRAEATRISELAQRIRSDERLRSLLAAVAAKTGVVVTQETASSPASFSSSFFSHMFSSSSSNHNNHHHAATSTARQTSMPWGATLAQLLALAELPPSKGPALPSAGGSADPHSSAVTSSSSLPPPTTTQKRFAQVIATVASSSSSDSHQHHRHTSHTEGGDGRAARLSLVTLSHAVLPMRPSSASSTLQKTSFVAERPHHVGGSGGGVSASTRESAPYSDKDDEGEDEGAFDRLFARLKQQATARHHSPPNKRPGTTSGAAATTPLSTTTPSATSSLAHAGLTAARAALDAADALLLRVRQQNAFSTAPSGRLCEAETLVLRATVCREAQQYTDVVLDVVQALLQRHEHAECSRRSHRKEAERPLVKERAGNALQSHHHPWSASVASPSAEALNWLLQCNISSSNSASSARLPHISALPPAPKPCGYSADRHGGRSPHPSRGRPATAASSAGDEWKDGSHGASLQMRPAPTGVSSTYPTNTVAAASLGGSTHASPTSTSTPASALSFYSAPHSPSTTGAAGSASSSPLSAAPASPEVAAYLLSHELVTTLQQWQQLVGRQRRALRCAEVHDYVAAGQLFLGAAAERMHLGTFPDAADIGKVNGVAIVDTPAADLAAHGFTHLLRACGLLLSDPLMEHEIAYPTSLLSEVSEALERTTTAPKKLGVSSMTAPSPAMEQDGMEWGSCGVVLPPPLLVSPHAARVWMLLAQLATFVERHHLQFPWDVAASATPVDVSSSASVSSPPPPPSPVVQRSAISSATTQALWELSTAALLFRPADALRVLQETLTQSSSPRHPTTPEISSSLHNLFHEYLHDFASSTTATPLSLSSAVPRSSSAPAYRVVAQPGTVSLCLLSLRRASAAAVRAGHHAEALRDVGVALLLLETTQSAGAADSAGCDTATTAEAVVLDFSKVCRWSEEATTPTTKPPTTTFERTSRRLPALRHFTARVHFVLMQVLLLLLTTPWMAGEAVAEMLKQGEVCCGPQVATPSENNRETGESTHPSFTAAKVVGESRCGGSSSGEGGTADFAGHPEAQSEASPSCKAEREDKETGVSMPVVAIAAALRQSLGVLHAMTHQLALVEREGWIVQDVAGGMPGEARTPGVDAAAKKWVPVMCLVPYVPLPAFRPSTAWRGGGGGDAATAEHPPPSCSNAVATSRTHDADASFTADLRGGTAAAGLPWQNGVGHVRRNCALLSSARYQQLKQRYQAVEDLPAPGDDGAGVGEQHTAASTESDASVAVDEEGKRRVDPTDSAVAAHGRGAFMSAVLEGNNTAVTEQEDDYLNADGHDDENDEASSPPDASSTSLHELTQLVQELLILVCLLTLPLRAPATNTTTRATPLSLPHISGALLHDNSGSEEGGYDKAYMQARLALNGFAGRLAACLRRLRARDRTLFTLLRRLQVELLFPAVCGPPL
jgi:hypothetical protein